MYVVIGASGNTGHVVASKLLAAGKKVRVIGRSPERLTSLAAQGAETFAADVTDAQSAARAFAGAEAAYVMIPPDSSNPDPRGYADSVAEAIAAAIENQGVKHVVTLSSIGADKPDKTGPIAGLHRLEERLKRIPGLNSLNVRAAYFMENTLPQVQVIQHMGVVAGPLNPELKVPMIATRDIGEFAAGALLGLDFTGHQAKELLGQRDLTYSEVTHIIGEAIGKPDLAYRQLSDQQFQGALVQMGMSQNFAQLMVEMAHALNSGHVRALETRAARNSTPTSYEQFVKETLAPAFRKKSVAA